MATFPFSLWNDIALRPIKHQIQISLLCFFPYCLDGWLMCRFMLDVPTVSSPVLGFYNKSTMSEASDPNLNLSATQRSSPSFILELARLPLFSLQCYLFPSALNFCIITIGLLPYLHYCTARKAFLSTWFSLKPHVYPRFGNTVSILNMHLWSEWMFAYKV